jgi:hypothetical protein
MNRNGVGFCLNVWLAFCLLAFGVGGGGGAVVGVVKDGSARTAPLLFDF